MQPQDQKRFKLILTTIVVIVLAMVGWQIAVLISHHGKVKLTVEALPHDSTVTMDGQDITSNGDIYVTPGVHTFKVSRQYFDPDTEKIDTKYQGDNVVYLLPIPNSQQALDYLKNHPDVQQARESAAGSIQEAKQAALLKRYPLIQDLPVNQANFSVNYSTDDDANVTFEVTPTGDSTSQSITAAYDFLKSNGIDPTKEKIITSNLDTLADNGLTSDQVDDIKRGITDFAQSNNQPLTTSVIVDNAITNGPLGQLVFKLLFAININGKVYNATASYNDLESVTLRLQDSNTHKTVYNQKLSPGAS